MKKNLITVGILFLLIPQTVLASFPDVAEDHLYAKAIGWLQENKVVKGYEDGTFQPDKLVNRAEFVKMLYEARGENGYYMGKPIQPFLDVEGGEWYGGYATKAYMDGVVDGYKDGTFKPERNINLAEALKIVINGFFKDKELFEAFKDLSSCEFDDVDLTKFYDNEAWYAKYAHFADGICAIPKDIIENKSGKVIFNLSKDLTRGEMAELIYRTRSVLDNSVVSLVYYEVSDLAIFKDYEIEPKSLVCSAMYQYDANGYTSYPVSDVYSHLPYLGQLFTAEECGEERLAKMYGIEDGNYILGINLSTKGAPSAELLNLLQEMEFQCPQGVGIQLCTTWILNSPVELKDILKLKPYHQEISRDSCMECKMEDRVEF